MSIHKEISFEDEICQHLKQTPLACGKKYAFFPTE